MNKKQTERWAPVVLAIVVLLIWQLVCTVFQIPEFLFPSPIAIGQSMAEFAAPGRGDAATLRRRRRHTADRPSPRPGSR